MTKTQMLSAMSSEEFSERLALDRIRQKEREKAERHAKARRRR